MSTDTGDRAREFGDGVVVVEHGTVAGATLGPQAHPRQALLGRLDQVDPATLDRDREAAHLTDGLGAALECVPMVIDQPVRTVRATGLLVGGEREHDRPVGQTVLPGPLPDHREQDGVEVLHVDGPASPDAAVRHLARERIDLPVRRVRRDDVEVAVQQQRRLRAVRRSEGGEHVRPAGLGFDQLGGDPDLGQARRDVLRGHPLPWPGIVAVVRGVDPDQVGRDPHDLVVSGAGAVGHGTPSLKWQVGECSGVSRAGARARPRPTRTRREGSSSARRRARPGRSAPPRRGTGRRSGRSRPGSPRPS